MGQFASQVMDLKCYGIGVPLTLIPSLSLARFNLMFIKWKLYWLAKMSSSVDNKCRQYISYALYYLLRKTLSPVENKADLTLNKKQRQHRFGALAWRLLGTLTQWIKQNVLQRNTGRSSNIPGRDTYLTIYNVLNIQSSLDMWKS